MTDPAAGAAGSVSATWSDLATTAPDLAAAGLELLDRGGGEALLATVRGSGLPRVHPVTVAVVDGRLYVFIIGGSPKAADLESDGRYALHAHVDPHRPTEFSVRGRARRVDDPALRAVVAGGWAFAVDDTYRLFELRIAHALLGVRDSADEWPPRYASWSAAIAAGTTTG
jgi:hypothetical protein